MNIEQTITAFVDSFVAKERDDGTTFYTLGKNAEDWMRDAVMEAHNGSMPYDWRYEKCMEIVETMREYDPDDLDDCISEIVDGCVDIYTGALRGWYADHAAHAEAVEDARTEGLIGPDADITRQITVGQYYLLESMAHTLLSAIRDNVED